MICIIDYGVGNLFSLKSSLAHLGLEAKVSADAADICAADRTGDVILEVKYDAFLPEVIAQLLQTGQLRRDSYSKYGACRRFG